MGQTLNEIWTHLHDNAEISWEEFKTTEYIVEQVTPYNPNKIETFDDMPGVVVEIGSGKPVVGVRADMDALWQEVGGVQQANHSCGHDAHMTTVIGVFKQLAEKNLNGTVRFIFQPAEEKGNGALAMVEKGVADDLDYLFGMHLRPKQELSSGEFAPAIIHGSAKFIKGSITSADTHGARPHLGINAIEVAADMIHHIRQSHFDPLIPHSIKMTELHAGGKNPNIIPGKAHFALDLRAQQNELMDAMSEQVERIARQLESLHNISIELETGAHMAAAVYNEEATALLDEGIQAVDADSRRAPITTTGGDDFHFYTLKRPQVKATMLAIGCDLGPGLHHPDMTFNFDAIPKAVDILSEAVEKALSQGGERA
ncbi:amidohydrolase [Alkalibacillus flavidus]|uniref:Amidohydrolase n=1 Tax=Alkalibacillus flavidus TaxID=546021 RepID=A0ABV2KUK4_9BACI